jgi:hypothetical protein
VAQRESSREKLRAVRDTLNRVCSTYDDEIAPEDTFSLGDAGVFLNELNKNGFRIVKKSGT